MKKVMVALFALAVGMWSIALQKQAGRLITSDERKQVIDGLVSALNDQYVFPDLAKKAEKTIRTEEKLGTYDKIEDGQELAIALTKQLNEVCQDAHLRVRFSPQALPVRKDRTQPTAEEIALQKKAVIRRNAGFQKVERLLGNIGYISFDNFMEPDAAQRPMKAAMEFVANTESLIIDLRNNGGGSPETVRDFCSYFFDAKPVHLNDIYFREGNKTFEFWTNKKVPGKRYLDRDIYILAGPRTGSGAEEFCYDLQALKRAVIVGEKTWGGANPGGMVRLSDHFMVFVPTGRAINPYTKKNWEGTGILPDVPVSADEALMTAHRMALQKLIEKSSDPAEKEQLEKVKNELTK